MRTLRYGYDIDYEGDGEVLQVTATPRDGSRELLYDERLGLLAGETLTVFPSAYVITRRGAKDPKKIALTFDDGPDPRYTPAILDTLRRLGAPATFFVVGLSGDLRSDLLRRELDEGHEIGNHTFTHPDVSAIGREQFRLELNATERLLESRLGRGSLLFRPPYAEDVEPETPDQVAPLLVTSQQGYYTIGMRIDPGDWRNPGVEAIVRATLQGARQQRGNVVLLHDGGGDRAQTVAALPAIVLGLREQGFELTGVSRLLGLTREAVMPELPHEERLAALVGDTGFRLIEWVNAGASFLFTAGIVLGLLRLLGVATLAVWQRLHPRRTAALAEPPDVSVIVPAFNEERVIARTLQALLASTHPSFEIVVVDDGSEDATFARALEAVGSDPRVRVLRKPNGGKASALNYGLLSARAGIVVTLDADTWFEPETLERLVRPLADPRVGAVAGNVKVGNRVNLLTWWQALEYVTSQNLDRRAFEVVNGIGVVPGAAGAWRREAVERAGGYLGDTLAEDADLTLAILRRGYEVRYADDAVAWTEAPERLAAFLKQRFRWTYGTLQAAWKQRDTALRPRFGALGLLAIPNMFAFQVLYPLLSPFMDLQMGASLAIALWRSHAHPGDPPGHGFEHVLFYYALFLLADCLASAVAFALERDEDWSLLAWLFVQRLVYRQLLYLVAVRSLLAALRGRSVGWGKLERRASVA